MPDPSSESKPAASKPKRPTLKDIATEAGVSIATVSQALNPRSDSNIKIPSTTVEKIKGIARQFKYRPHAGARSIRTNRFQNIGFFIAKDGVYTHMPDGYMSGIHDAAEKHGYRITLIRLPQNPIDAKVRVPAIFEQHNLDALIVASYHFITKQIHAQLKEDNLPIVYVNDCQTHNTVHSDDRAGAETLVTHLIERGYKKISFVHRKPPNDPDIEDMHYSAVQRRDGYLAAMKSAGLEPRCVNFFAKEVLDYDEVFPEGWWEQVKDCDALFAYDDELANRIARFLYNKGIRIPEDIGLAGFNGDYAALSSWRRLTTMRIPSYEIGKAAFEMALKLIESDSLSEIPSLSITPELVPGKTIR